MLNRIREYFKREAKVHINYYHEFIDGKAIKVEDSFKIYICQFNSCKGLIGEIDWNEVSTIITTLKEANGDVILAMNVFGGETTLLIPKWAKQSIINQLETNLLK